MTAPLPPDDATAPTQAPEPDHAQALWHLVIPVRSPAGGKTRLGAVAGSVRPALARAIAQDTILAASRARSCSVLVVTDDAELSAWCTDLRVAVLDDPGGGLNPAIAAGLAEAVREHRAALLGDLPSLTPDDLDAALTLALTADECFIPDLDGTGTVLRAGRTATPSFGADSASRHRALGAQALTPDLPRLRRDVDDADSLAQAIALGVGRYTSDVLAHLAMD